MSSEMNSVVKNVEGLIVYLMEFEPARPPAPFGIIPYSWSLFFELLFKQKQRNYFLKNNKSIYERTMEYRSAYFENGSKIDKKDVLKIFGLLILFVSVLGSIFIFFFFIILDFNFFQYVVSAIVFGIPISYLFIVWLITRRRNYFGKKYDGDIKLAVQCLIDYGVEFVRENDLDPLDFPVRLRHDDYDGLVYEKKGKNKFVGVFKK